jgi:hypothetical protein
LIYGKKKRKDFYENCEIPSVLESSFSYFGASTSQQIVRKPFKRRKERLFKFINKLHKKLNIPLYAGLCGFIILIIPFLKVPSISTNYPIF